MGEKLQKASKSNKRKKNRNENKGEYVRREKEENNASDRNEIDSNQLLYINKAYMLPGFRSEPQTARPSRTTPVDNCRDT
jgi:hypothetical protein